MAEEKIMTGSRPRTVKVNVSTAVTLSATTPTGKTNVLYIGLGDAIYVRDGERGHQILHRAKVTGFQQTEITDDGGDVIIEYTFEEDSTHRSHTMASSFGEKFFIAIGINELAGAGESNSKIDTLG